MNKLSLRHLWIAWPTMMVFLVCSSQDKFQHDLWQYLSCGRTIVESGQLIHAEPFSHNAAGREISTQGWLSHMILYLIFHGGGMGLLRLVVAAMYSAAFSIATAACLKTANHQARVAGICAGLAALISLQNLAIRPQVFSVLFFSIEAFVLLFASARMRPVMVGLIMIGWTNTHAAFVLGILLPSSFLVGSVLEFLIEARRSHLSWKQITQDSRVRSYLLCFLVSIAAAFCNPDPLHTFGFLSEKYDNAIRENFQEWQPVSQEVATGIFFYCSIAVMLVVLNLSRKRLTPTQAVLCVVFLFLGGRALRFMVWWALIMAPILADHLATLLPREQNRLPDKKRLIINYVLAFYIALFSIISLIRVQYSRQDPAGLAGHLKSAGFADNIFNASQWGGYLIWTDRVKVFADSRIDPYPSKIWTDYWAIANGDPEWQPLLDQYKINTIVASKAWTKGLVQQASKSPQWAKDYEDDLGIIYKRLGATSLPASKASTR